MRDSQLVKTGGRDIAIRGENAAGPALRVGIRLVWLLAFTLPRKSAKWIIKPTAPAGAESI
jgi:hypothetical protein